MNAEIIARLSEDPVAITLTTLLQQNTEIKEFTKQILEAVIK